MSFFANLKTRAKLLLCFSVVLLLTLLVAGTSVKSNIESIDAAQNIDTILTRSYGRVNSTQSALLNANILAIRYLNPWDQSMSMEEFEQYVDGYV